MIFLYLHLLFNKDFLYIKYRSNYYKHLHIIQSNNIYLYLYYDLINIIYKIINLTTINRYNI